MSGSFIEGVRLALWSAAAGVLLCAAYDLLRLFRDGRSPRRVELFFADLAFCLFAGVVFSVLFFNLTYGSVRFIAFVFAAFGFAVWRATAGRLVYSAARALLRSAKRLCAYFRAGIKRALRGIRLEISTRRYRRRVIRNIKRRFKKKGTGNEKEVFKAQ